MGKYLVSAVALLFLAAVPAGTSQAAPPPPTVEISADLGSCSASLLVTDGNSKPIYAAKVTARVLYGPFSVKKLDLEAYTGADGRLKITHLPAVLKKPLRIHIAKDMTEEEVLFQPEKQCDASFEVKLQ